MGVVVIDLGEDMALATRSIEVALGAAKATEERAAFLLVLAKAKPEALGRAREIYGRAKARAAQLEEALAAITEARHGLRD
jgi:hypothetical protein